MDDSNKLKEIAQNAKAKISFQKKSLEREQNTKHFFSRDFSSYGEYFEKIRIELEELGFESRTHGNGIEASDFYGGSDQKKSIIRWANLGELKLIKRIAVSINLGENKSVIMTLVRGMENNLREISTVGILEMNQNILSKELWSSEKISGELLSSDLKNRILKDIDKLQNKLPLILENYG